MPTKKHNVWKKKDFSYVESQNKRFQFEWNPFVYRYLIEIHCKYMYGLYQVFHRPKSKTLCIRQMIQKAARSSNLQNNRNIIRKHSRKSCKSNEWLTNNKLSWLTKFNGPNGKKNGIVKIDSMYNRPHDPHAFCQCA